jgi:hypothetical protein
VNSQAAPSNGVIIGNRKPDLNSQLNFLKLTSKQVNYAGGGTQQNYDFDDMVQGEWHHHAVVKSGSNLQYYRDGVFVGTRAITKFPDGPFPFYMGGDPAGSTSEHFKGFIDDVVLYNRALISTEIVEVMNATDISRMDAWRMLYFGTTASSGTAADDYDANFDGESNLLEFATNQNPHASTLTSTLATVNGANIEFRYTRSKAAMTDGISFNVAWSDSLQPGSWSTTGVTESLESESSEAQQVLAVVPMGTSKARFLHLKITP